MLCYYVSDIHLELCDDNSISFDWLMPNETGSIIILAGDIGDPFANHFEQLIQFLSEHYEAIVYVPGNHEYYSSTYDLITITSPLEQCIMNDSELMETKAKSLSPPKFDSGISARKRSNSTGMEFKRRSHRKSAGFNITSIPKTYESTNERIKELTLSYPKFHPLLNDTITINGIAFVGTTLWSWIPESEDTKVEQCLNDFKRTDLTLERYRYLHREAVEFLFHITKSAENPMIIVTHHLPTYKMIAAKFQSHPLNCCFASHCDFLLTNPKVLKWICGHSHAPHTYKQCSSNPIGYPFERVCLKLASFML